jgi:cation transport ATPase
MALLIVLILLFLMYKIHFFSKKKTKEKDSKIEIKEVFNKKKIEEKGSVKVTKKNLIKSLVFPFGLFVLLWVFFIFEVQIVDFLRGFAIELAPIDYVNLFVILGLVFVINGLALDLKSKKNKLDSFIWILHGLVFSLVSLFYELLNITHIFVFGFNLNWLVTLLVFWEAVILINIFAGYKKIFDD